MVPSLEVTLNIRDVPVLSAMRLAVRQAAQQCTDLTMVRDGSGWLVKAIPLLERAVEEGELDRDPRFPGAFTIDAENAPLRDVLARVFRNTEIRYEVDPTLADLPVTIGMTGTATDALQMIAENYRGGKPMARLTRERGVYCFRPPVP
jgi:hypothetical protein